MASSVLFFIFLTASRASCISCQIWSGRVSPWVLSVQNSLSVTHPEISKYYYTVSFTISNHWQSSPSDNLAVNPACHLSVSPHIYFHDGWMHLLHIGYQPNWPQFRQGICFNIFFYSKNKYYLQNNLPYSKTYQLCLILWPLLLPWSALLCLWDTGPGQKCKECTTLGLHTAWYDGTHHPTW